MAPSQPPTESRRRRDWGKGVSTTHELKTWPQYFQRLLSGEKTFEVRKDDRGYQAGDVLALQEFDKSGDHDRCEDERCTTKRYSGRELRFRVGFIYQRAPGWLDCGEYVVMSLLPLDADGGAMTDVTGKRVWRAGDPEPPPDVTLLYDRNRTSGLRYLRRAGTRWLWVNSPDDTPPPGNTGWDWQALSRALSHYIELIEVP
jgi:hypothetical protein